MFLLAGLQLIPTGGRSITAGMIMPSGETAPGAYDPAFLPLGRARLWDVVPLPVVIMAVVARRLLVLHGAHALGPRLLCDRRQRDGGAPGRRADQPYRLVTYVLSGSLASLGGLIIAARVGRGDVSSGASLLLDSVAAALIGFAVLDARRPNVLGTVVGAIFVGILLNGLTMLNAPYYTQDFVKGAVLVGALAVTFGLGQRA